MSTVIATRRPALVRAWLRLTRPVRVLYLRFVIDCVEEDIEDIEVDLWMARERADGPVITTCRERLQRYGAFLNAKRDRLAAVLAE